MYKSIPNLTLKRFQDIKDAAALTWDRPCIYHDDFYAKQNVSGKHLKKLGFKTKKAIGSWNTSIFVHPKWKIVVKQAYFVSAKPRRSVPTVKLKNDVVIQAIADTTSKRAWAAIMKHTNWDYLNDKVNVPNLGRDDHKHNIGLYKGKLVAFDW